MSASVVPILVAHLALTALPGAAAALLGARAGLRQVPLLLAIALAASGTVALLSFWAYYAEPLAGETLTWLVLLGSVGTVAWSLYEGVDRGLLRALATPLGLWALGAAFLVFFGFLYGGTDYALTTATTRFSGPLPSDNRIPFYFAEWFFEYGHDRAVPVFPPEWLSSDRPPLQMGYVLSQRALDWGEPELHYQVLGVVLQQLWIVGLWALLLAARVGRIARGLALITVLLSDLAIVNGFFVWPKLLPAAFLLAAAALVATPLWPRVRGDWRAAALLGALFALALLGHGSSIFGVVPLAAIAALRGLPRPGWVAAMLLAGAVLLLPWLGYQRLADPPGNRLAKWMLGGSVQIDDRGAGEAIVDGYRDAGIGGTLHNKGQNFVTIAGGGPAVDLAETAVDAAASGDLDVALREVRGISFLYLIPSLGLLLLGPVAMAVRRGRVRSSPAEWRFALACFAIVALGCLAWALVLFGNGPSRTVIHVGSYLIPVLALCGAAVGLRASFPRFAVWYLGANALLTLALYVPYLEPLLPGSAFSPWTALAAAACLAGFAALAFLATGYREEGGTRAAGAQDQTAAPR